MPGVLSKFFRALLMFVLLFALETHEVSGLVDVDVYDEGKFSVMPRDTVYITFLDALAVTLRNNRDIKTREEEIKAAQSGVMGAWGAFLPRVNFNFKYAHNDAVLDFKKLPFVSGMKFRKDPNIFMGYIDDNNLGFSVDQVVFNGGKNISDFTQAGLDLEIQKQMLRVKKQAVKFEVKRLYYGLLLAYETEKIARELVRQSELHYQQVSRKFDQGTASRFEVLQSKVQVSKVLPELVKAANAVKLVSAELNSLMGREIDSEIKAVDRLGFSPVKADERSLRCRAYLERPDIIMRNLGIDVRKQGIEAARSGAMPQVGFRFDYGYRAHEVAGMFNSEHRNWQACVAVTIPVFDGFSAASKINAARARYEEAVIDKADILEQAAVEVKRACFDLEQNEAIINALRDSIVEAEEALKIAITGYENGVVTNLDVIDSQISLSQVSKNYLEAEYDYIMAEAYMEKVTGMDVQGEDGSGD
ncbi:MAG: TolC family protein [Candidatus Omnitrophota bacterium]